MIKGSDKKQLKRYVFFGIFAIMLILSFLIIKPYFVALISAFILSYLLMPLYKKLNKKIGKTSSALICILLVLLILIVPLGVIVNSIVNQADASLTSESFNNLIDKISSIGLIEKLNISFDKVVEKTISFITSLLGEALTYLPSVVLSLIIILFGMYYILTNWDSLALELKEYLPFKDKKEVSEDIDRTARGLIHGTFLIAIIQFLVAVAGFYLSGVESYFLLPFLIFFLAFIPGLGPTFVWLPLALYYFFTQNYFTLIGVLITGLILTIFIDTILRAKIIGKKSKINPFILLVGVLGGISIFGIFGFVIGPLILVYTMKLIQEIVKSK